jgi:GntR family transcriptional regulator
LNPTAIPNRNATPGKLYLELASLLRRAIETARWRPGERLPALEAIAAEFGVSIITVRQAVALLRQEGLLISRHGVGTFVPDDFKGRNWIDLQWDFNAEYARIGFLDHTVQIIEERSNVMLPDDAGGSNETYNYLKRVHYKSGTAYALANLYVARSVFDQAQQRFRTEMMLPLLYEMLPALSGHQSLTIGSADLELARTLQIALNSPVGEIKRFVRNAEGETVFHSHSLYRGDIVRLETKF